MRFDEFVLRVPGAEDEPPLQIRFHDRLTVLAGLGALEREAIVAAVVGGLTGEAEGACLRCVDHTGRPVEITTAGGEVVARYRDDGTPAPTPVGWLVPDALSLRDLVVVTADDLGPSTAGRVRDDDPPLLVEARVALRRAAEALEAALAERARLEQAERELATIDERLRAAEEDAARREYARVLARLDRVRAEASAIHSGARGAEVDRRLLASADGAAELAERWRAARAAVAEARSRAAGDEALEDDDVARLADVPGALPADLPALVAERDRAEARVRSLEERLREVASASLPEPDDPRILALAGIDQDELWAARDALVAARDAVAREQVAVGGIGIGTDSDSDSDGERDAAVAAVAAIEEAHRARVDAEARARRWRLPAAVAVVLAALASVQLGEGALAQRLVLWAGAVAVAVGGIVRPLLARRRAAAAEAAVLARAGVPTYLGFHLRRVDATLDPSSLGGLALAVAEREAAERSWAAVAGEVEVEVASALEPAVREYATAMASRADAVAEVAQLRRSLDELARPDLEAARGALGAAVAPYHVGLGDVDGLEPDLVLGLVERQVALGHAARRLRQLAAAERDEAEAAAQLEAVLARHGFGQGDLPDRVTLFEAAVARAAEREAARAVARPRAVVEAELDELGAEARRLWRPEWDDVVPADAEEPDLSGLLARRDQLAALLAGAEERDAHLRRLTDEHAAAERRVASLERRVRGERADDANVEELQRYLLAALTRANHVGPRGESVPVVLDDPFVRVPAERKWELMDMLRRLAEKTQVLYLTDDPFIGAWARRRSDTGSIRLLEPVE